MTLHRAMQEEVAEAKQKLRASQQEAKAAQDRALGATAARKDQAAAEHLKLQASTWPVCGFNAIRATCGRVTEAPSRLCFARTRSSTWCIPTSTASAAAFCRTGSSDV